MTAVADNGQVYWTFEDLDLQGAFDDLKTEIHSLLDKNLVIHQQIIRCYTDLREWELCRELRSNDLRIDLLLRVLQSLEIVIRRGR